MNICTCLVSANHGITHRELLYHFLFIQANSNNLKCAFDWTLLYTLYTQHIKSGLKPITPPGKHTEDLRTCFTHDGLRGCGVDSGQK